MEYTSEGYLKIRAFTASEALPVANAVVRIYGADEENIGIDYSLKTNASGQTEVISLPAPNKAFSLTPNASEQAYGTYNVELSADGFSPKLLRNVSVFSEILSILPVGMLPDAQITRNVTSPQGINTALIYENEELE